NVSQTVTVNCCTNPCPPQPLLLFNPGVGTNGPSTTLSVGDLVDLPPLANQLTTPTSAVDGYIVGRLSPATIVALAAYQSAPLPKPAPLVSALTTNLLNDINTIILGANIYDPVRF